MSEQKESSVLFSLKELMNLEEDRIKTEEADRAAQAAAAERARQDAERQAREAEQARIRAEEERRRAEEQRSREEAARLEAIRVAEIEKARVEAEQRARLEAGRERTRRDREGDVPDLAPGLDQPCHRPAAPELAVVGMRGEHQRLLPALEHRAIQPARPSA